VTFLGWLLLRGLQRLSLRGFYLFNLRWHVAVVMNLPHCGDTARFAVQRVPDFQQDTLTVLLPLMIPKSQFFDALRFEKLVPLFITLMLLGHSVLKAVEFDRELCGWTIEIENVSPSRILATEFESRKTSRAQRMPEFLFLLRLLTTESAGVGGGIHVGSVEG